MSSTPASVSGSVKRVVVTSSMAAVTDEPDSGHTLTEADWNVKSSLDRNPYYYSKTLAEKAAWDFMAQRKPFFDLVAINPFMVIGPSLTSALNTSNRIFVDLLKGTYPGILSLTWGFVDVRDVAAGARARARGRRRPTAAISVPATRCRCAAWSLCSAENGYAGYKLPKRAARFCHAATCWSALLSFTQASGVGSYLRSHVGRVPRYDTSKIRTELGMSFRPVEQSVLETMQRPRPLGASAGAARLSAGETRDWFCDLRAAIAGSLAGATSDGSCARAIEPG